MNDPIRILKADHREVKQLMTKLRETEEGAERTALANKVVTKLTAHMEIEAAIVYPPVRSEVGEEDAEEATIEHGLACDGLQKMMSLLEAPGFGAAVEMVKAGIEHHVDEEETEILPELKESLSREEWLALGDQIAKAKQAAGLPVPQPSMRRSTKRNKSKASASSRK